MENQNLPHIFPLLGYNLETYCYLIIIIKKKFVKDISIYSHTNVE